MSRLHQNLIDGFVKAQDGTPIPEVFRRWTAISVIAGAMGRRVWYDWGTFEVRPNMFIVLIAPPGRNKSVSLILPFQKVYGHLTAKTGTKKGDEDFNPKLAQYGLEDSPLYIAYDSVTPQHVPIEMIKCHRVDLRLSTTDEVFHDSSMTHVVSEFGLFVNRNNIALHMLLTDLWDSRPLYSYKTKTAGEYLVEGPCYNWLACATPDQLVEHMPENARSQGLLSRLVLVSYDGPEVVPSLYYGKGNIKSLDALRWDLAQVANLRGPMKVKEEDYGKIDEDLKGGVQPAPTDRNLVEYVRRRASHLMKLVMCVSAAKRDDMLITWEDWCEAKALLVEVEKSMPATLANFGMGEVGRNVLELREFILNLIKSKGGAGIPLSLVRRITLLRAKSPSEVEQTIKLMVDAHMIKIEDQLVSVR